MNLRSIGYSSMPNTPYHQPRWRLRCKMCRQELATREHRPSSGEAFDISRRGSVDVAVADGTPVTRRLSTSADAPRKPSFGAAITAMSAQEPQAQAEPSIVDRERRPSAALESDEDDGDDLSPNAASCKVTDDDTTTPTPSGLPPALASPQKLAAQIHPNLAALRSSPLISALSSSNPLGMAPMKEPGGAGGKHRTLSMNSASPPLLMPNVKCSGYFVEPMKWMTPFLESGNMTGKIVCPNKKCAAKLGNYDWAGVCCSCKEWVVPGFCIHKSKVDEVVI